MCIQLHCFDETTLRHVCRTKLQHIHTKVSFTRDVGTAWQTYLRCLLGPSHRYPSLLLPAGSYRSPKALNIIESNTCRPHNRFRSVDFSGILNASASFASNFHRAFSSELPSHPDRHFVDGNAAVQTLQVVLFHFVPFNQVQSLIFSLHVLFGMAALSAVAVGIAAAATLARAKWDSPSSSLYSNLGRGGFGPGAASREQPSPFSYAWRQGSLAAGKLWSSVDLH